MPHCVWEKAQVGHGYVGKGLFVGHGYVGEGFFLWDTATWERAFLWDTASYMATVGMTVWIE